jgi:homeobox-leucine zipper protein
MEDDHEACNTRLHLGLGFFGDRVPRKETRNHDQKEEKPLVCLDFMFPREEAINVDHKADRSTFRKFDRDDEYPNKENDSDSHPNKDAGRKKLRLSKDQSILLEDCFKLHSTLSPVNFPMLHFINFFFFFFFNDGKVRACTHP